MSVCVCVFFVYDLYFFFCEPLPPFFLSDLSDYLFNFVRFVRGRGSRRPPLAILATYLPVFIISHVKFFNKKAAAIIIRAIIISA